MLRPLDQVARRGTSSPSVNGSMFDTELPTLPYLSPNQQKRSSPSSFIGEPRPTAHGISVQPPDEESSNIGSPPCVVSDSYPPATQIVDVVRRTDTPSLSLRDSEFKRKARIHFAALCWCFFVAGWNDGTTGVLITAIQKTYNVGYVVVSLLFVLNCVGFIAGAFTGIWLNDKFGFGKVLVLGASLQGINYALQAPAGPFVIFVLANCFGGLGLALQYSQANGFVGSLKKDAATKLSLLHASYGVGAVVAPLVATQFAQMRHWSFHYLISLGLAISNTIILALVFKLRTQEVVMAEEGQEPAEVEVVTGSKYRQILKIKAVHSMAFFLILYVGVEVTLGGWIVTFIIQERDGGRGSGYISSGFFSGLTIGRVALMWINRKIGEQKVIFLYSILAIGLEITVWLVPSLLENGIAIAFIGVLLGPMFPIVMNHASHVLPPRVLTPSIGWITAVGQTGSAALPFLSGLISAKFGIASMQPLLVAMMLIMAGVWALVPKVQRRVD